MYVHTLCLGVPPVGCGHERAVTSHLVYGSRTRLTAGYHGRAWVSGTMHGVVPRRRSGVPRRPVQPALSVSHDHHAYPDTYL